MVRNVMREVISHQFMRLLDLNILQSQPKNEKSLKCKINIKKFDVG